MLAAVGFMQYRKLGRTNWSVSVLAYGAGPLGGMFGEFPEKEGLRSVRTALDQGINFIDVAPAYGATRAETVLGKALREVPRERYYLATKVGRDGPDEFDFSAARVTRSVEESLRRLRVSHIDLIQCHDVEFVPARTLVEETLPALHKLKREGKVRKIGVTALPLRAFKKVLDEVVVDTVLSYCHYCLNNITLVRWFPYFKSKGVGLINAAPLAMGLLTHKPPPRWHPAPADIREACARAAEHCRKRKASLARLALQFAAANPVIATTIVGTADAQEVRQNVRWLGEPIDLALLTEVQEILAPIRNRSWASGLSENN